jgi:hypothetical protein
MLTKGLKYNREKGYCYYLKAYLKMSQGSLFPAKIIPLTALEILETPMQQWQCTNTSM